MQTLTCYVIVTVFLITPSVHAQQNDSLITYNLEDTIVVTATRSEKNVFDVGRSVSIITNEQINSSIYLSPSEVLAEQEGISVVGSGQNPGSQQSLFLRGSNRNQMVVMMDGMRITDPSAVDNALDLSELSLSNIQRIEVVRGGHSTLYGSSAIGGAINILSHKHRKQGLNADANLRIGTFGDGTSDLTQNLFLNYTFLSGLYFNAEVYNSRIRGFDSTVDTVKTNNVYNKPDKDNFYKRDMSGKVGFVNDNWDVFASLKWASQETDIDDGAYQDDDNNKLNFDRYLFNYGAERKFDNDFNLKYMGGYSSIIRKTLDDSSIVDFNGIFDGLYSKNYFKSILVSNEIQANIKINRSELVFGGGLFSESMTSKTYLFSRSPWGIYESYQDLGTHNIKTTTSFLFSYIDLKGADLSENFKKYSLSAGCRFNHHSSFGARLTYEISPAYKVNKNTLLYISHSTGFNAPSLYRLFTPDVDFMSGITRGNKNLNPEISSSYEFGLRHKPNESAEITVTYFSNKIKNYIDYVYLWDKNIAIDTLGNDWMRYDNRGDTYLNIGTMYSSGFEFNFYANLSDELFFRGNASIIDGSLKYKPSDIDYEHTQGHHVQLYSNGTFLNKEVEDRGLVRRSNTINISLTYLPIDDLTLKIATKYVGGKDDIYYNTGIGPWGALDKLKVSDYTLLDFSARYNLTRELTTLLKVENLLDTKYIEIFGYATRGRSVYLSLRYTL